MKSLWFVLLLGFGSSVTTVAVAATHESLPDYCSIALAEKGAKRDEKIAAGCGYDARKVLRRLKTEEGRHRLISWEDVELTFFEAACANARLGRKSIAIQQLATARDAALRIPVEGAAMGLHDGDFRGTVSFTRLRLKEIDQRLKQLRGASSSVIHTAAPLRIQ